MKQEKAVIIGDLHIFDKADVGLHKDYWENCKTILNSIVENVKENEITHVIMAGDWIGVATHERNMRTREGLTFLFEKLQELKEISGNPVYTLRGNHDIGSKLTEYEMFNRLGYLENPEYLDIDERLRIHLVNYGEEEREINLKPNAQNVAITHNNITVEGGTDWYFAGDGLELSTMENFKGIDIVISGHIHHPSPKIVKTTIGSNPIELFYPGCPTRPRKEPDLWDSCYMVILTSKTDTNPKNSKILKWELPDKETLFYDKIDTRSIEEELENSVDIEQLSKILESLHTYKFGEGIDYITQIDKISETKEVAEVAKRYIREVEGE